MVYECDRSLRSVSFESSIKIHTPRSELGGIEELNLKAFLLENPLEKKGGLHFVPGRISRIDAEVTLEDILSFAGDYVPVELVGLGSLSERSLATYEQQTQNGSFAHDLALKGVNWVSRPMANAATLEIGARGETVAIQALGCNVE